MNRRDLFTEESEWHEHLYADHGLELPTSVGYQMAATLHVALHSARGFGRGPACNHWHGAG